VAVLARSASGEVAVSGGVQEERGLPVADVQLWVSSASERKVLTVSSTDSTGSFKLKLDSPGSYLLNASRERFFEIKD
jgi:hypothetical protein